MLRLKPSELTLTPEDVDETLCRMARRQPPRFSAASGPRRPRTSGRPLAPRVMPGAERFMGDAFTNLGNIPILRPQPQQAIIAYLDDETQDAEETVTEPADRLDSSPDLISIPTQPVHPVSTSSAATAPSTSHSARLPFQLGRPCRGLETSIDASSSPKEQSDDSESTLVGLGGPPETTNVSGPATPDRRRANGSSAEDSSPTRQPGPSSIPAALRGGASHPQRNRARSTGQEALYAPSPLRQTRTPNPTHHSEESSSGSDEEPPVLHLQGYFDFKSNPNVEYTYRFREAFPNAPRTEPYRRTRQQQFHARSHSSNEVSTSRLLTPRSDARNTSTGDDVFWTTTAPATGGLHNDSRTDGRPRLRSSEMSSTSLAYSYYELPEHRQSSGEHSAQDPLSQTQYDGTAASRQASRGTYRSVRLSEAQAFGDNTPQPPTANTPSFATPFPAFAYQWGTSPLPAEPYARTGNMGNHIRSAFHRAVQDDSGRAVHSNAIAAVMENCVSPLDALTAQYGWASHRFADRRAQPPQHFQYESQGSAYYSTHPNSSAYGPPMAMADDPYTRGATAHAGQSHAVTYAARPVSAFTAPSVNYTVPPYPSHVQIVRSSQRSSENAPVVSSIQSGRVARNSQVQDQVSAFEQMHSAAQPRQTRQRLEAPQAASRPRTNELSGSPMPSAPPVIPPRHGSRHLAALSPGHGNAGRRSARMDPRLQNQENSGEAELEMMRHEYEAVRTRYDEGQQGDVMDETPPRIGRVERHM